MKRLKMKMEYASPDFSMTKNKRNTCQSPLSSDEETPSVSAKKKHKKMVKVNIKKVNLDQVELCISFFFIFSLCNRKKNLCEMQRAKAILLVLYRNKPCQIILNNI